jgi:Mrp family chromosome partitioning ATPase
MIGSAWRTTADVWRDALMVSSGETSGLPGFAKKPHETLGRPKIDRTFVEHCRRAFLGLAPRLGERGVIAVVSPHRREGRSTVAAGLALSIATDTDQSVLLLDLDLEHPAQGGMFSITNSPGLSDYLQGHGVLRLVSGQPNRRLWLLPAGTDVADPARLLHQLSGGDLLVACRERFDWIVVDLPPLVDHPEAAMFSAVADAHLLVGRYRASTISALRQAAALIPADRPAGFLMTADHSRIPRWLRRIL